MGDFPWTYDQFQRYSVLKACIEVLFREKSPQVLDVGGTSPDRRGEACWFPVHKTARSEAYVVDIISCPGKGFIQGDGRNLPFKDNSFDLVCCLDVLEHIEEADREGLLQELCRVSRDVVLLANPFEAFIAYGPWENDLLVSDCVHPVWTEGSQVIADAWYEVLAPPISNIDSDDYDGDGTSDIAIFRPSSGLWGIRGITRVYFGDATDIPVPGDYNNDGITDIGIFRSANRGISWSVFGDGLPNVVVHDLVAVAATDSIVAFTHGRGAFRLVNNGLVFADGFESGDTARWSAARR